MPLQTSQSSNAVIDGKEFFRIHQELQSSGDVFELDASANAIYVGPNSDIAEMLVTYFDKRQPTGLAQARIAPGSPLVFRVDASNVETVPSTGQKARILISPVDLIDNNYTVSGVQPAAYIRIKPKIDVIQSLTPEASLPSERSDFTFRSSAITFGPGTASVDRVILVFPVYSRRLITATVSVPLNASAPRFDFTAVTLSTTSVAQVLKPLRRLSFIAAGVLQSQTAVIDAARVNTIDGGAVPPDMDSEYGQFDLLLIEMVETIASAVGTTAAITIRATDRK